MVTSPNTDSGVEVNGTGSGVGSGGGVDSDGGDIVVDESILPHHHHHHHHNHATSGGAGVAVFNRVRTGFNHLRNKVFACLCCDFTKPVGMINKSPFS